MNKKIALLAILPLLLLSSLAFPVLATPDVKNPYTYIIATIGEPETVDPAWLYDTASAEITMNVYEPLIFFDGESTGTFLPALATDWTISEDGMTYTFTIREGVQWHDPAYGTVTPRDIEYSLERWMVQDRSGGPTWMLNEPFFGVFHLRPNASIPAELEEAGHQIDDAVESDATTVTLNLHMAYAPLLTIIAQSWAGVLSEQWCTDHGDFPGFDDTGYVDWYNYRDPEISPLDDYPPGTGGTIMMGCGPYMLDYWEKGVEWSLVKFDDYYQGWPAQHPVIGTARGYLTRITEQFIDEWATRKLLFLQGDADSCYVPRAHLPEMIPFPEGIRCIYPLSLIVCSPCFFFNYDIPTTSPFLGPGFDAENPYTIAEDRVPVDFMGTIEVRKALGHAFDYDSYLRDVFQNEAKRQYVCIPEPLEYFNPDQTGYEYDLALATQYFQEAAGGAYWTTGFTIGLSYNTGNEVRRIACEMVKQAVESINPLFHVDVIEVPWPTFLGHLVNFELSAFVLGWLADFPDAHNFVMPFMDPYAGDFTYFQSVQYGQSGLKQSAAFGDPALDIDNDYVAHLISLGIQETDPAVREEIYAELQVIYVEEVPSIPLAYSFGRRWEQTWVQGWYYNAIFPGGYFYHYWKEELPRADLDQNGVVTILDIAQAAKAFGSSFDSETGIAHPRWNAYADINDDFTVNIVDVAGIAMNFGFSAPDWTPPA